MIQKGIFKSLDGTAIYYEIAGRGPSLLFCYGLACRVQHWRHQIEALKENYTVITWDYRGHHRSSVPSNERHLSLQWCATDASKLLDHLGITECVGLGHSMGVAVLALLAGFDKRLRGAVFICGAVKNPFEDMFFTRRSQHLLNLFAWAFHQAPDVAQAVWGRITRNNKASRAITARLGFNPGVASARDVLGYLEGVNQTPFLVFYHLLQSYSQLDPDSVLAPIDFPVLAIAGELDLVTPQYVVEAMVSSLKDARLKCIANASHNAHADFPEQVNGAIKSFFEELSYN